MLEKTKKLIPLGIAWAGLFIAPIKTFAEDPPKTNLVPTALSKNADIIKVMKGVIQFILVIAFVIAFIMLLIGGIRWILAGGDEKSVEKARNTITAALIGLVVVLVAYALIRLVETFFGVGIISNVTVPFINTGNTGPTE